MTRGRVDFVWTHLINAAQAFVFGVFENADIPGWLMNEEKVN